MDRSILRARSLDRAVLENPERHLLEPGGCILFARVGGEIVGTCGLRRLDADVFELTKMAVTDAFRGHGIGMILARAVIARARALGRLVLETNSRLRSAVHLYQRLGFELASAGHDATYGRTDTRMALQL